MVERGTSDKLPIDESVVGDGIFLDRDNGPEKFAVLTQAAGRGETEAAAERKAAFPVLRQNALWPVSHSPDSGASGRYYRRESSRADQPGAPQRFDSL